MRAENLRAIAKAATRFPALTTLEIWCGRADYGFTGSVADFAPILAGDRLPALRTLRLMNCELAADLIAPLARSAILPRLATLGLAMGKLTDDDTHLLREHRAAFAHLALLELDDNYLTRSRPRGRSRARGHGTDTDKDADDDGDDRYVSSRRVTRPRSPAARRAS